ncbi:MAG: 3',5'-cyclic-nucleotide phosphodiesterase [Methylophilaceae bacterium]|nr:3',5'-cyclic-nucleotide phosphodiesterase [Methylophilaceae bacterium]
MKVKVLGCSGGIGDKLRTTSLLVGDNILIDAGTGAADLSIEQLLKVDHIFVTHSHLDHIACIPLLLDTVIGLRINPVTVHATKDTITALKQHIFNWVIWPDFNEIPSKTQPFLQYHEIVLAQSINLGETTITVLPANHVVPAVGYQINSGSNSLVFSGDTTSCDALWAVVNKIENLKYILIETAFSNGELELAKVSKHFCPSMLADDLDKLTVATEVFITHLKPIDSQVILQEIISSSVNRTCKMLINGQEFTL